MSEETVVQYKNLAPALAAFQGSMGPLHKDKSVKVASQKGSYSFKYAPLESIIEAIKGPLSANGLSFSQTVDYNAGGKLAVVTRLYHSSGEWISSMVPMDIAASGMQALGSAITYARRYGLTNILGLAADEDDDGNASEGNKVEVQEKASPVSFEKLKELKDLVVSDKSGSIGKLVEQALADNKVKSPADLKPTTFNQLMTAARIKGMA